MARQFDLYRTAQGDHVLVLQSDLLEDLVTRAVCLAVPEKTGVQAIAGLSPVITAGDIRIRIVPYLVATLTLSELGVFVANFSHDRDRIIRSMDLVLTGS